MSPIRVLQTSVAAYRLAVYDLAARIDPEFKVVGGDRYFSADLETVADSEPWFVGIRNRFAFGRSLCWQVGAISRLARADAVLAELNPRILSTWILFLLRRLRGKRSLFWGHVHGRGRRPPIMRRLRRAMLNLADGMVAYTDSDAVELCTSGYRKPIWTARNSCVVAADVQPVAGRQSAFVYVGRLVASKKPVLMIRAFALFVAEHPDMTLEIVGSGPERPELERQVKAFGIGDSVRFHGEINRASSLREVYEDALAAVSPGYVGLSAIQSMAHGVPILVARDEPHAPEIESCLEGRTCEFFDADSPEALAGCFARLVDESAAWKERRQSMCDFVIKNYTIDRMAAVLVDALRDRGR